MPTQWRDSYERQDRLEPAKRVMARVFGDGENPLAWGFTALSIRGLKVRLHLLFIGYLLAELIFTLPGHKAGVVFVAPGLAAVVGVVIGRELARAWVCRRAGCEIDELMLWPVGSLAPVEPGGDTRARVLTAVTPVAAQLGFLVPIAAALWIVTGTPGSLVFNPLSPASALPGLTLADGLTPWWLVALWSVHVVNIAIVLINLLPMPPLDAGLVLGALLSRTSPDLTARSTLAIVGMVTATLVGLVGIVFEDATVLLGVAIVCGLVSSFERQRLNFLKTAEPEPWAAPDPGPAGSDGADRRPDPEEVDRVLAKVSSSGMKSLSRRERRVLKEATRSSRGSDGRPPGSEPYA